MGVRAVFVWSTLGAVASGCGSRSSLDDLAQSSIAAQQASNTTNTASTLVGATTTVATNQHPSITPANPATTPVVNSQPPNTVTPGTVAPNTGVVAPDPTHIPPDVDPVPSPPEPVPCTDADAVRSPQFMLLAPPSPSLQRIVIPTVCGDGRLTREESCDDANVDSGDGCSATCQTEPSYECAVPGSACVFTGSCGDGVVAGPEHCEYTGAPGCSDQCTLESGWICPLGQPCLTVCGDGITAGIERCDDGNNVANDGCSPTCRIEFDYCRTHGCDDGAIGVCGDGAVDLGEACDDSGVSTSCSQTCQWVPQCNEGTCASICGDGVTIDEGCDDGNVVAGDGCDAACHVEAGFQCTQVRLDSPQADALPPELVEPTVSQCTALCGDEIVAAGEACDQGELNGIEGYCGVDCTLGAFCGNGILDAGETCDDGRNVGLPGDLSSCPPGCVATGFCGDAIVQQNESCDSGRVYNNGAYNGCTSYCTRAAYCGDGQVQECGYEACDPGVDSSTCANCRHITVL